MNQLPAGLVPMMMPGMPQQYMVMPGGGVAAMQLPPGMSAHHPHAAMQPAAMLHHQQLAAQAAQAAASHAAGAPVITSPVVTSAGGISALAVGHHQVSIFEIQKVGSKFIFWTKVQSGMVIYKVVYSYFVNSHLDVPVTLCRAATPPWKFHRFYF